MNAQLANLSFLVLLCSMICYWIGPLSRDLFGNDSSKNMVQKQKDKKQLTSSEENNMVLPKGSTVLSTELNKSSIPSGVLADGFPTKGNNTSNNTNNNTSNNTYMLFPSDTNASPWGTLQKSYSLLEKLFNNIKSKIRYVKAALTGLLQSPVRAAFNISQNLQLLGRSGIILSNVLLIVLLCNRWKESGHFPLSNLYESLMFLSWSFTVLHLFIENLTNYHTTSNQNIGKFIGAITTPSALFTNAFATFTLPKEMQGSSSLVPALQSNWLMMHVTVMIISYAALIIGSLLSIAYLIITIQFHSNSDTNNNKNMGLPNSSTSALTLDNLSYRILGIGFPFLTIGILSGAVWANEAWGSYWSWDPKETWAFLTWLVYAIYLHTRLNKGWEGKKPAIIASFGFIVTWICYLGVNLIGEGLHSYGWILK